MGRGRQQNEIRRVIGAAIAECSYMMYTSAGLGDTPRTVSFSGDLLPGNSTSSALPLNDELPGLTIGNAITISAPWLA